MSERDFIQRKGPGEDDSDDVTTPGKAGGGQVFDVSDLLDEIDSVLEENAEEFVKGFVQKGGQ